jgi:hypothetical protein
MSRAVFAANAVAYTQRVLGTLPSNHPIQRIVTLGESRVCVGTVRHTAAVGRLDDIAEVRRIAALAKAAHCGNCGEYAAVAFDYLMLTNCPYDIEYACYAKPGDHAFVIVGRPFGTSPSDPSTWGPDVVVCDAWDGSVVPAHAYWSAMPAFPNAVHAPEIRLRWRQPGDYPEPRRETMSA